MLLRRDCKGAFMCEKGVFEIMKKIIRIISGIALWLLVAVVALLFSILCIFITCVIMIQGPQKEINRHSEIYSEWQVVSIEGEGTFRVPVEWVVTQNDDVIYITDKPIEEEYNIFLIAAVGENVRTYELFDDVEYLGRVDGWGAAISFGVSFGKSEYKVAGEIIERANISFGSMFFIAWDDLVDFETIETIAYSCRPI